MNMKTLETLPGCLECQEVKSAAELKPCREAGTCYLCGNAVCKSADLPGYDVYRFCSQACYEAELARQGVQRQTTLSMSVTLEATGRVFGLGMLVKGELWES